MAQTRRVSSLLYNIVYVLMAVWLLLITKVVLLSEWGERHRAKRSVQKLAIDKVPPPNYNAYYYSLFTQSEIDIVAHDMSKQPLMVNFTDSKLRHIQKTLDDIEPRRDTDAPGEMGRPVIISESSLTALQRQEVADGYRKHGFNEFVSDRISLRRKTPDFRSRLCRGLSYPADLPRTTVIICFHNEAWSTLLRTVFSVLDNTPPHLLQELILVDDFSDSDVLDGPLEEFVRVLPSVRLIRSSHRLGLIGARLLGTDSVTSEVITFLDSHVECMDGWLEPMLNRILENDRNVVYPVLHHINNTDFNITKLPASYKGLFNWMDLHYFPYRDTRNHVTVGATPIRSPTMPGGIFSISKRYFDLLGRYDPKLKTWGGENTELSFKVWMCGGSLEALPCSNIGHVFRNVNPNLGSNFYTEITTNAMRVAYVWMDDYKYFFFNNFIENGVMPKFGDVTERISLRRRLQCHPFHWYMKHIATDLYAPVQSLHIHEIHCDVLHRTVCLAHTFLRQRLHVAPCQTLLRHEKVWYWDDTGQLLGSVLDTQDTWACLSVDQGAVTMEKCGNDPVQQWKYTLHGELKHQLSGLCVTLSGEQALMLSECSSFPSQKWKVLTFRHQSSLHHLVDIKIQP